MSNMGGKEGIKKKNRFIGNDKMTTTYSILLTTRKHHSELVFTPLQENEHLTSLVLVVANDEPQFMDHLLT